LPVRELIGRIPAPRGDHGKNKDSALTEQFFISVRIALADTLKAAIADKALEIGWNAVPRPAPVSETMFPVIRNG
jgi:hypothetical protein